MLDIKLIRENPEKVNELLKRRNPDLSIDAVLAVDEERRQIQTQADELRAKRKNESQKIGMMKKNGENTDAIQEDVRKLGDEIKALEEKQVEYLKGILCDVVQGYYYSKPDEFNNVKKLLGRKL